MANVWEQMSVEDQAKSLDRLAMQNLMNQQSQAAAMAQTPVQTNLAPLMQLTDQWTGSNLAQGYTPPKEVEKKIRELNVMTGGLTEDTVNLLRAKLKDKMSSRLAKAAGKKEPKATQWQAAGYGKRMEQADAIISELETDPTHDITGIGTRISQIGMIPEGMRPDSTKRQDQAERNFINAVLRRESGAAIAPSEFDSAEKQYFPRWGDNPQLLRQKADNRRLATESLRLEAGQAWGQYSSDTGGVKTLQIGDVEDGYRWLGGNKADMKNWEKAE